MKSHLFTVTIGIPARNEERTIGKLIKSILSQNNDNFILKEIIVYSDVSTDSTIQEVKRPLDPRVRVIEGKKRIGTVQAIKTIISLSQGEIIVLLDADIQLALQSTIQEVVAPFYKERKLGLVAGNRKAKKAKTFMEKAIHTSLRAYDNIAIELRSGKNPYSCHGQILALSQRFASSVDFPVDIVNVDAYLYFSCLKKGYQFYYAKKAKIWMKTSNNLKDAILQYKRYLSPNSSKKYFDDLPAKEYSVPFVLRMKCILVECLHSPAHALAFFLLKLYCKFTPLNKERVPLWTAAGSTKG